MILFHGGCHGCTQQEIHTEGADFCIGCQYFQADWSKPDLNNKPESLADTIRAEIKARLGV